MIKKILIVDDSMVARMMIQNSIPADKGYEILVAFNGKEGVEKYRQHKPDVTFMDLTMPELDGFTAIEQILAINPKTVIIALTADIQSKSISRVTELGAFAVVQKPAKPDIIQSVLKDVEFKLQQSGV
jgi:two-component system, chemotaxis family, chemotaxis protein CheY